MDCSGGPCIRAFRTWLGALGQAARLGGFQQSEAAWPAPTNATLAMEHTAKPKFSACF